MGCAVVAHRHLEVPSEDVLQVIGVPESGGDGDVLDGPVRGREEVADLLESRVEDRVHNRVVRVFAEAQRKETLRNAESGGDITGGNALGGVLRDVAQGPLEKV